VELFGRSRRSREPLERDLLFVPAADVVGNCLGCPLPKFVAMALNLAGFDAALRDARPRRLTRATLAWLYETTPVDGVTFTTPMKSQPTLRA
jgi:hypothetical protein